MGRRYYNNKYHNKRYKARKYKKDTTMEGCLITGALVSVLSYWFFQDSVFVIGGFIIGVLIYLIIIEASKAHKQNSKRQHYLNSSLSEIDKMTGEEFEYCLQAHYEFFGYIAQTTPQAKDFGADLLMEKDGKRIVLQAKRYKDMVGIKAVQEVIGARDYYKASEAIVATNSHFSDSAKQLAESAGVQLIDRKELEQIISKREAIKAKGR